MKRNYDQIASTNEKSFPKRVPGNNWANTANNSVVLQPVAETHQHSVGSNGTPSAALSASCGSDLRLLEVKKEGENKGRSFYTCSCQGKGSAFMWKNLYDSKASTNPGFVMKCKAGEAQSEGEASVVVELLQLILTELRESSNRTTENLVAIGDMIGDVYAAVDKK